jgi:hypothetical protein
LPAASTSCTSLRLRTSLGRDALKVMRTWQAFGLPGRVRV